MCHEDSAPCCSHSRNFRLQKKTLDIFFIWKNQTKCIFWHFESPFYHDTYYFLDCRWTKQIDFSLWFNMHKPAWGFSTFAINTTDNIQTQKTRREEKPDLAEADSAPQQPCLHYISGPAEGNGVIKAEFLLLHPPPKKRWNHAWNICSAFRTVLLIWNGTVWRTRLIFSIHQMCFTVKKT